MLAARDVVVVGMGRVGRRLVHELHSERSVTVVDLRADRLDMVPTMAGRIEVRKVLGDGTSRLVLDKAGVVAHTTLVVAMGDDTVNREVARLAREVYHVIEMVVLLGSGFVPGEGLSESDALERHSATAALVLNRLNVGETRGVALGLGKGELRQITVMEGSAAAGRPLAEIHPHRWLVAAVYRDDVLLVPHGQTVLVPGDRVLLVGQPEVLSSVAAFIRGGRPVFPTQYGERIGVLGEGAALKEAAWLMEHTLASEQVSLSKADVHPDNHRDADIASYLLDRKIGCVVMDPLPISWTARVGLQSSSRKRFVLASRVPILVARGTLPYRRILLAVGGDQDPDLIAQVSIDLARQCGASITVLTVLAPSLAEGSDEQDALRSLPGRVAHIARLHGVVVEKRIDHGNPIERIRHHAKDFDLLVVGHSARRRNTLFTPDVSLFLLHDTPCSVMFVPWNPAGL